MAQKKNCLYLITNRVVHPQTLSIMDLL